MTRRRVRVDEDEQRVCPVCGRVVPASRGDDKYCCGDAHELEYLRERVKEQDERIARMSRKKGPIQCLGQVRWSTCVQEWYLKDSYDAKRRAVELRKLGYVVAASTIGRMPFACEGDGGTAAWVKVTILTAVKDDGSGEAPPPPGVFVDGIRTNGNERRTR